MNTQTRQNKSQKWTVPFFTIWTGQALSLLGSRVAQFAIVWWLTETTGSATVLATASMVAFIPEVFLAPIAGAYVDRWNRRIVMILADGFIALASLWLAVMFWLGTAQVWHIYALMLIRSIGGSFHWPAMQASTSLMVPKEQLTRVAGINQTLYGVLGIAGPPLGAILMELLPLQGVMLIDVGTAALAIIPLFFIHIPQPERTSEKHAERPSVWTDFKEGLRYVWGWTGMLYLIVLIFFFKIASAPAFSLMPLLVKKHFSGGAAQLSLLQAILGVGTIVGGLVLSAWGGFRKKIVTSLSAAFVFSFGFLGLGLAPGNIFEIALASAFVIGFTLPMIDGPFMAIMQSSVEPEMQGRVFTLAISLLNISAPFSLAIAGPISDKLGLQIWYIVAGVICIGISVIGLAMPAVMNIERKTELQEPTEGAA
jgi:DHA3 family macrolide efflux protein-like MFS transporter